MRLDRGVRAPARLGQLVLLLLLAALVGPLQALAKPGVPDTSITSKPPSRTAATSASFSFTSSINPATFACSLDSAAYSACTSPATYSSLAAGKHSFSVRATAGGATDPTPASASWTITVAAAPAAPKNSPEGQGYSDSNTPQANSQAIQAAVDYANANSLRLQLSARTYTYAGNVVVPSG